MTADLRLWLVLIAAAWASTGVTLFFVGLELLRLDRRIDAIEAATAEARERGEGPQP